MFDRNTLWKRFFKQVNHRLIFIIFPFIIFPLKYFFIEEIFSFFNIFEFHQSAFVGLLSDDHEYYQYHNNYYDFNGDHSHVLTIFESFLSK